MKTLLVFSAQNLWFHRFFFFWFEEIFFVDHWTSTLISKNFNFTPLRNVFLTWSESMEICEVIVVGNIILSWYEFWQMKTLKQIKRGLLIKANVKRPDLSRTWYGKIQMWLIEKHGYNLHYCRFVWVSIFLVRTYPSHFSPSVVLTISHFKSILAA